jgi:hypothetical protein
MPLALLAQISAAVMGGCLDRRQRVGKAVELDRAGRFSFLMTRIFVCSVEAQAEGLIQSIGKIVVKSR